MRKILEKKIGIIGCGTMGLPMLEILKKNNVDISGHDIKNKKNFIKIDNHFIEDKYTFFNHSEVIISAVRDKDETIDICEGKNGLFYFSEKKILLISSTLSPLFIREIRKRAPKNITLIDAPMSGAPMSAKKGSLTFMIGCTKAEFNYIKPLLTLLGKKIKHIGSFGQGMSIKVLNNFVASCSVVAVRNVLSKSRSFGITPEKLLDVLRDSSGQTWFSSNLNNIDWATQDYKKENTIAILEKDIISFLDAINSKTPNNPEMKNFQEALIKGLRKIPSIPKY